MADPEKERLRVQRDGRSKMLLPNPHVCTVDEVAKFYGTSLTSGLPKAKVEEQQRRFGGNELDHAPGKSLWRLIMEQFQDLLVRILLAAALVSFILAIVEGDGAGEGITAFVEPFVILLILVANAIVSVWQESSAEKALEALKELQPEHARVLRDSKWHQIATADLVPGDVVDMRVGDRVPADIRIAKLLTTSFRLEQSQLTGECVSVSKDPTTITGEDAANAPLQDKSNIAFSSTTIANGHALGVVTATGMLTEIGNIQAAVEDAGDDEEQTPLAIKVDEFGQQLSKVIAVICILVWIINFKNFSDPAHGGFVGGSIYYFKIAVALAVAAIPEGLPAVITACLALGTRKMAQKNAIVRRLTSVETLGCTTVICSDKTGTLTTNEMSCLVFYVPSNQFTAGGDSSLLRYTVDGTTYAPVGRITPPAAASPPTFSHITEEAVSLQWLARVCSLCNDARLTVDSHKRYHRQGEPTEAALSVLVEKLGCPSAALNAQYLQRSDFASAHATEPQPFAKHWAAAYSRLAELEFTRDRKSMSVLCKNSAEAKNTLLVKGAPESVVSRCDSLMLPDGSSVPLTEAGRGQVLRAVAEMATGALRTLALAVSHEPNHIAEYRGDEEEPTGTEARLLLSDPDNFAKLESNLTFVGLVGLLDPPREEVSEAIDKCYRAGIRVIMITGDNKLTAEAIARKVGVVAEDDDINVCSFTGREFETMDDEQRYEALSSTGGLIFSRTEPRHKQTIIRALKEMGEVAAMTGDGVNDAPALKQADIGIAMGIAGTEVAKEASDMVLADDNFSTIVVAVEEGRSIFNNMKAFIRYLISSNIGEVASIFFTAALGVPEGLAPVQLLWVNLVTDGPPATALGFNPPDVDVMQKPPRHKDESLISGWIFVRYMIIGLYVGVATVGIFIWWYVFGVDPNDGHSLISFWQLTHWTQCKTWPDFKVNRVYGMTDDGCSYFNAGKVKASTLSLTVLVVIEMLNALNALSEKGSLLTMPPWVSERERVAVDNASMGE
eukprot:GHVU01117916.1.p1 GENE.GHVU01117916.1~~GHVU01117916.1.p1  ORF type:complete len:1010 (+),score=272.33 GHVU01117916.1:859-3888(+)